MPFNGSDTREHQSAMRYDHTGPAGLENDEHVYRLKSGSGFPKAFTRAEIDVLGQDVLGEAVDRFRWDDSVFALARILALRPSFLSDAVEESFARHTVTRTSAPLSGARLNLYGIYPSDLNTWERPFAELLDADTSGIVRWWHRIPVRMPYSITLPVPGHVFFYPDLAVGIEGRDTPCGVALVEIKHQINDPDRVFRIELLWRL
jgi:hypothetical protein